MAGRARDQHEAEVKTERKVEVGAWVPLKEVPVGLERWLSSQVHELSEHSHRVAHNCL